MKNVSLPSPARKSTFSTGTLFGTSKTVGAKLRMPFIPALTSRSATSWAASAGVAMSPISMPRSRTASSSLENPHRLEGPPEAGVVGEGLAQPTHAHDPEPPAPGKPEDAHELAL